MSLKSLSRPTRILIRRILFAFPAFVIVIVVFSLAIELYLRQACEMATRKYPGDEVEALIAYVESNENTLRANNRAFWALGQLGDKRALPFLRKLATGKQCEHETNLCQVIIREAMHKLEKDQFNLPAFLWRGLLT